MNADKKMTNCPNCSSNNISYDIKTETLKCNHCNQKFSSSKVEKKIKEIKNIKGVIINEQTKTVSKENKELYAVKCCTCGAIKYVRNKDKYTHCRLCQSKDCELVDNASEEAKYILPFLINREEVFSKHKNVLDKRQVYSNEKFLSNFKEENLIGIYVPYRIENCKYSCSMCGDGYSLLDINHGKHLDTYIVQNFKIKRDVEVEAKDIYYERVDEDIITREDMLENIISEVNPYDIKEKIELKKEYLEECIIIKPNEKSISADVKKEKLANIAKYAVLDDITKYDYGVKWDIIEPQIINENHSYVYLPIWLYFEKETINNKTTYYYVAINGRTNEIGMQLPFNKTKAIINSSLLSATILSAISYLIIRYIYELNLNDGLNMSDILLLVIGLLVFNLIANLKYKSIKAKYKGSNVVNENDDFVEFQKNIINREERVITNCQFFTKELVDRNDNFYRRK